ncbi:unnamed protein product [Paramecium octaurelia]|uniref:Uncharacterized protein n=1 Tax=Paramecium octaurelia TaxID=43137 RepID=A0A8S1U4K5_PAROT|nr:unnamed protein product [Paramecium octaurelia]
MHMLQQIVVENISLHNLSMNLIPSYIKAKLPYQLENIALNICCAYMVKVSKERYCLELSNRQQNHLKDYNINHKYCAQNIFVVLDQYNRLNNDTLLQLLLLFCYPCDQKQMIDRLQHNHQNMVNMCT